MVAYCQPLITKLAAKCRDRRLSTTARGRAFEQLFAHLLDGIPSLVFETDTVHFARSDEIDIAVAHSPAISGLGCYPPLFLVEAKNWEDPVDSASIAIFLDKLRDRHVELGILVAAHGVTGDPDALKAAHFKAASAQTSGTRLVLITMDDILRLQTSNEFVTLLIKRVLGLAASGTFQLNWI
jgi:hypothetical protein